MRTLQELGLAVSTRREALGLKQRDVAAQAGLSPESLSRFERGRSAELGSRKLLAVLAVLGLETDNSANSAPPARSMNCAANEAADEALLPTFLAGTWRRSRPMATFACVLTYHAQAAAG